MIIDAESGSRPLLHFFLHLHEGFEKYRSHRVFSCLVNFGLLKDDFRDDFHQCPVGESAINSSYCNSLIHISWSSYRSLLETWCRVFPSSPLIISSYIVCCCALSLLHVLSVFWVFGRFASARCSTSWSVSLLDPGYRCSRVLSYVPFSLIW